MHRRLGDTNRERNKISSRCVSVCVCMMVTRFLPTYSFRVELKINEREWRRTNRWRTHTVTRPVQRIFFLYTLLIWHLKGYRNWSIPVMAHSKVEIFSTWKFALSISRLLSLRDRRCLPLKSYTRRRVSLRVNIYSIYFCVHKWNNLFITFYKRDWK